MFHAKRDLCAGACSGLGSMTQWGVISIADMLPAPRINDVLHRVTFAAVWESPRSQVLGQLVLGPVAHGSLATGEGGCDRREL